jgi:hypothetical protein
MTFTLEDGFWNPQVSGPILSIQEVDVAIAGGASSGTATISAVSSLASIVWAGNTSNTAADDLTAVWATVTLTNSTTVTANRGSAAASALSVKCYVIDWSSDWVESVQFGSMTTSASTTATATISSVTTSRSAVFFLGHYNTSANTNYARGLGRFDLTNSTTVTLTKGAATTDLLGKFCVVQFKAAKIQSLQTTSISMTSGNSSATATISAVTANNTFMAYGGCTMGSSVTDPSISLGSTGYTNTTTITATRSASTSGTVIVNGTVIEFTSGTLNRVQREAAVAFAASTATRTRSNTAVDTTKTFVSHLGNQTTVTTSNMGSVVSTVEMTAASTMTATRGNTANDNALFRYEEVEFV